MMHKNKEPSIQCMGGFFYAAETEKTGVLPDYNYIAAVCDYGILEWVKHYVIFQCRQRQC